MSIEEFYDDRARKGWYDQPKPDAQSLLDRATKDGQELVSQEEQEAGQKVSPIKIPHKAWEKREFGFREESCTAIDDDKICGLIFNFIHLAAFRGKIDAFCAFKPKEIFVQNFRKYLSRT